MVNEKYSTDSKFLARQVWADSVDADQTARLIRVYTICHSVCIFWTQYSQVKQYHSNFRIITAVVQVSEVLGFLRYTSSYAAYKYVISNTHPDRQIYTLFEQTHDKTNQITVCPVKIQISLGILPVWSESSLCAQWVA